MFNGETMDESELECSMEVLLAAMGLPEFQSYFERSKVGVSELLNLQAEQINDLFPNTDFSLGDRLKFKQKYTHFMATNNLTLHSSFRTQANFVDRANPPLSKSLEIEGSKECRELPHTSLASSLSASMGSTMPESKKSDREDGSGSESSYHPDEDITQTSSEDSDDEPVQVKQGKYTALLKSGNSSTSDKPTDLVPLAASSTSTVSDIEQEPSLPPVKRITASPLVDQSKIGKKRLKSKGADKYIDELNLETLLEDHPLAHAVLVNYENNNQPLTDCNRSTLLTVLVPWVLKRTNCPSREHYEKLTSKICQLFSSEVPTVWYVAPKTEGPNQHYPKGKLPDRVKNSKTVLRKKGCLTPVKRTKGTVGEATIPGNPVIVTDKEAAAIEWLKRNHEPFEDVKIKWKICAKPRLTELFLNSNLSPHEYMEKWHGLLQLPAGYKLVLEDFNALPSIFQKYGSLKDKSDCLLLKWTEFSKKILEIANSSDSGLTKKEKQDFLALLESSKSQNDRDYIILQILPVLCKQKGRVKVGHKLFKPSCEESKEAFILHVTVASELEETLRKRQQRHMELGAPVQPFICVQGESIGVVRGSYVVVNQVPWKTSSVLQAVDLCFKTCFVLNCGFPPEAQHMWLLIQKYFYDISMSEDKIISSVTNMIQKLQT